MATFSVCVTDLILGRGASGLPVALENYAGHGDWKEVSTGLTDSIGCLTLTPEKKVGLPPGRYRLTFQTTTYFQTQGCELFFPYISLVFELPDTKSAQEMIVTLSPHGYCAYRNITSAH